MKCPDCGGTHFDYDAFEDMYRCVSCEVFYYPQEVGEADNRNAPIFRIEEKESKV